MVAGVVNIALATLVTLSVLALAFAGYYSLVIRDAAIDAASRAARFGAEDQQRYLMERLDLAIPELASYEVLQQKSQEISFVRVRYYLPGLGFLGSFTQGQLSVAAAAERL